ncbi:MAG: hypothetical protein H7296_05515 [Bacteroidia bacterium]|nr:hypothetical protein [Bacteroidia bacterium]
MNRKLIYITVILSLYNLSVLRAQNKPDRELRINLNQDSSHYLKATFTAQVWTRYNESNPGTTVGYSAANAISGTTSVNTLQDQTFDIGLRRVRAQFYGKISDRIFVYTQVGINNDNNTAARKPGLFFHDVVAEYHFTPHAFQMGMGLTAWTGFARFSSPAIASILGYDAPLYQQSTNDATDQFLRKFSIYAKGKIKKFDYRIITSAPMLAQNSTAIKQLNVNSDFSYKPAKMQYSGYFMYQFLDEESNLTPYMPGTYLGKKKVFNIGAGFQYQQDAMWHYSDTATKNVLVQDMLHLAVDVFYDHPIGKKGAALSVYGCFAHMDYGKNYIRNNNPMNPADAGVLSSYNNFNGGGNLFPMYGTGTVIYGQFGYMLPGNMLGEKNGKLQPYIMVMDSKYDRLNQNMILYDVGLNWLMDSNRAKLSLDYQNRPVYNNTDLKVDSRKGMIVLQFQIAI